MMDPRLRLHVSKKKRKKKSYLVLRIGRGRSLITVVLSELAWLGLWFDLWLSRLRRWDIGLVIGNSNNSSNGNGNDSKATAIMKMVIVSKNGNSNT